MKRIAVFLFVVLFLLVPLAIAQEDQPQPPQNATIDQVWSPAGAVPGTIPALNDTVAVLRELLDVIEASSQLVEKHADLIQKAKDVVVRAEEEIKTFQDLVSFAP